MLQPTHLTRVTGPSSSQSGSSSTSYDYSGLDDLIKRQDAVSGGRDEKFSALYGGDVAGSVTAGNKVRDLVQAIRAHVPDASERNPMRMSQPLSRVSSQSNSTSMDSSAGGYEGQHEQPTLPKQDAPPKTTVVTTPPAAPKPTPPVPRPTPVAQPAPAAAPAAKPAAAPPVNPMVARGGRHPLSIPQEEVFGYPGGYVAPTNHVLGGLRSFGNYS